MEIIIGIVCVLFVLFLLGKRSQNRIEADLNSLVKSALSNPDEFAKKMYVPAVYEIESAKDLKELSYDFPDAARQLIRSLLFETLVTRGHMRDNLIKDFVSAEHLDRATNKIYNSICK